MAEAVARALRSRDFQLAGLGALVAVVALALAVAPPRVVASDDAALSLGVVSGASGEVKRRPAATLGWRTLGRNMSVYDGDSVFVPPGGEATLRFEDGTELALDERSLVVLERPRAGLRTLQLRQGAVSGRVGDVAVEIHTPAGVASLAASSEARVELGAARVDVSVKKGNAAVGGKALRAGQRAAATDAGVEALAPWPVELTAPPANLRRIVRGAPGPITLTWAGVVPAAARVQIAHDRLFAFLERDVNPTGEHWVVEQPVLGVTWWRVVDERGEPVSEARRYTLLEDVAPAPVAPRAGEVVLAATGTPVPFSWTALPGVTRYRLELSPSQGFEPVSATFELDTTEARVPLGLAEGTWFWRVRAADGEEPGLPSAPTRFRLIHKGIPDAPELLSPEIEVGQ